MGITFNSNQIYQSYVYIRYDSSNNVTYVGQCKDLTKGRPLRNIQNDPLKKVILLRCPKNRLDVREAYFILKLRPSWVFMGPGKKLFDSYYEKAAHLLKAIEKAELKFFTSEETTKEIFGMKDTTILDDYREIKQLTKEIYHGPPVFSQKN